MTYVSPRMSVPAVRRTYVIDRMQSGMTLLEMLVVLTLVALLGTLIIQGISVFLARYDAVQRVARHAAQAGLQQHWFASSVEAMVPYRQTATQFKGDATSFSGVTTQPLGAESGMPVTVRWSIQLDGRSSVVAYFEEPAPTNGGGLDWAVLTTDGPLAFQYAGADGVWRDHWPPRDVIEHIPRQVRLGDGVRTLWLATLDLYPIPVIHREQI